MKLRTSLYFIVYAVLLAGCGKPSLNQTTTGMWGTYQGIGNGFLETVSLVGPDKPHFTHILRQNGTIVFTESGPIEVKGCRILIPKFTEFVDSKHERLLNAPKKYIDYDYVFLEAPPFDMLKPFAPHEYYLKKISQTAEVPKSRDGDQPAYSDGRPKHPTE